MKRMLIAVLALMLVFTGGCFAADGAGNAQNSGGMKKMANRIAVFTTNRGTFEVELFEDKAPITAKLL